MMANGTHGDDGDDEMTPVPQPKTMILDDLHADLGARFATFAGYRAAADYGDRAAEEETLRAGCGVVDRSWVSRIAITGADRLRFLNGLVTCDLAALNPGEGSYGFFTQIKGRVLADATFLVLDDAVWLELPAGQADLVIEHMSRYRIADRVDFTSLADRWMPLTLIGPGAEKILSAATTLPAESWHHSEARVHQTEVRIVRDGRFGVPAWSLWVATENAAALTRSLIDAGVRPVGFQGLEAGRIEAGRARFGVDFGIENFPQETGLEAAAVDYTKGCYLGQEVVARIHYRGGVQRHLRGVVIDGDSSAVETSAVETLSGAELLFEGRSVGRISSVTFSSRLGGLIGLAIIHRLGAEPGTALALGDGVSATVVALPFDGDSIDCR